jgi:hypothetical protein
LPFQVALRVGDSSTPARTWARSASVNSYSHPAFASSGMYGGSTAIRSMSVSPAASRRTSCSRWPSAVAGRMDSAMRYLPRACWLQAATIAVTVVPLVSGLVYQVTAGGPEVLCPPQAASTEAVTAAATASVTVRKYGTGALLSSDPVRRAVCVAPA